MAHKKDSLTYLSFYLIADVLAVSVAVVAAYWIRFYSGIFPLFYGQASLNAYINIIPIIVFIFLIIFRSYGLYQYHRFYSFLDEILRVGKAVTTALFILMGITFIYREFSYSRAVLLVSWFSVIFFVGMLRQLAGLLVLNLKKIRKEYKKIAIVGTGPGAVQLLKRMKSNRRWGYLMSGFILNSGEHSVENVSGFPILGTLDDLDNILKRKRIDELILTIPSIPRNKMVEIILECEKHLVDFKLLADLLGIVTSQVQMENIDGVQLIGFKEPPLNYAFNRFQKRLIDVIISLAGLLLFAPAFIVISFLIKLTSKGPALYKQKRIGEDGKHFNIYKFRTMPKDAEKETGPVWTTPNDTRKTRLGSFLRRYNIDELPQLFNVFRGDMSLVGPRPERPHFVKQFKEDIPHYMARHKIKSGVTGWAQVNGFRGDTSIEERTKYDLYYIENWSAYFDIKILCMSFFALKNAY